MSGRITAKNKYQQTEMQLGFSGVKSLDTTSTEGQLLANGRAADYRLPAETCGSVIISLFG
jgi:hypothetical protein